MPSKTLARPFSAFLICSQFRITSADPETETSPKTCGCLRRELVVDRAGDVGQREPALLRRQRGMEHDLEQQVAQLLLEVVVPGAGLDVEPVDRVEDLVGLLQQVARERLVRLLPIPRALAAQGRDELGEPFDLAAIGATSSGR